MCNEHRMVMSAYNSLGPNSAINMQTKTRGAVVLPPLIQHPVLRGIAENYGRSPAQIAMRFNLQRNIVVIRKSTHPRRIMEDINIFNFTLTDGDMKDIRALDQYGEYGHFFHLAWKG